ncbi:hypothetical protein, partial [Paucibacter soli]|uniref:hypothetical protein n=1 Tax=Paucibacter soli TaxID=3133433 RepID=UPI003095413E
KANPPPLMSRRVFAFGVAINLGILFDSVFSVQRVPGVKAWPKGIAIRRPAAQVRDASRQFVTFPWQAGA